MNKLETLLETVISCSKSSGLREECRTAPLPTWNHSGQGPVSGFLLMLISGSQNQPQQELWECTWMTSHFPHNGEAHRCKYCYGHPAGHQDEKLSQTWWVAKEWLISRTSYIGSPFVHRFNGCNKTRTGITLCYWRIYQLLCQDEVRQCLAETRCPLLGVIQFTASWPQAAAVGTQKMAKTKIQGQRQSSAHCIKNIKLPEWQWVAPPSQHVHPKLRVYSWGHAPPITSTSPCMPRQVLLPLSHWWLGALTPWQLTSVGVWVAVCSAFDEQNDRILPSQWLTYFPTHFRPRPLRT